MPHKFHLYLIPYLEVELYRHSPHVSLASSPSGFEDSLTVDPNANACLSRRLNANSFRFDKTSIPRASTKGLASTTLTLEALGVEGEEVREGRPRLRGGLGSVPLLSLFSDSSFSRGSLSTTSTLSAFGSDWMLDARRLVTLGVTIWPSSFCDEISRTGSSSDLVVSVSTEVLRGLVLLSS